MKTIKVELPRELNHIKVDTLADIHLGDKECDFALLQRRIKAIKDDPNMYCILNGDLIDNATTTSIGDTYASTATPMEQIKTCMGLFEPIKDKIIAITDGNHEGRTYRTDGIDLTWLLARELRIEKRYHAGAVLLFLRFGAISRNSKDKTGKARRVCYTMYIKHGRGGGKRPGGKANRLEDMLKVIDTDIYIHSHTHTPMVLMFNTFRVDTKNSTFAEVEKLAINTGAFLEYGGYGEVAEYTPTSRRTPLLILDGTKKDFKALL
jgi:hypothetical protein